MAKKIRLLLEECRNADMEGNSQYRVVRVVNSLEWSIGEHLKRDAVDKVINLCPSVEVTIKAVS